jgi:CRP/FNR family transcriptional regulator, anaerobic regulatory protein
MMTSQLTGEASQPCNECSIRRLSLCAALGETELRELAHQSRQIHFAPGETVFAQEEMTTSFYNLQEGIMRLYKLLADGRRQIIGFALPGDFLGLAASSRHNFSADAIGHVGLCQFSRSAFARFSEDKTDLLQRINELAIRELSRAQDHMVLLGRRSAEEKVATFLIRWRRRIALVNGPSPAVPLPMSRQDIADYLGLTIETVSRTFTRFEREGVIDIMPGYIRLLNPARVEAIAAA